MNLYDAIIIINPTKLERDSGKDSEILWRGEIQLDGSAFNVGHNLAYMLAGAKAVLDGKLTATTPYSRLEIRFVSSSGPFSIATCSTTYTV